MSTQESSRMERLLDLLVEEIQERMEKKSEAVARGTEEAAALVRPLAPSSEEEIEPAKMGEGAETEEQLPSLPKEPAAALAGPFLAARLMSRLAIGLLIAIVLVNIPFTRHGMTLATAMPDDAAYVIRDGFVVKEENDEKIYVYQDGEFRWISSLDAFEHHGFTWEDVHIVKDGYLNRYEIGSPIHVLLKCKSSPHIYRLERGEKRWIRDIDTFTAQGHIWDDVRFVSCDYLRDLPDGETIPPGSGPPPQP